MTIEPRAHREEIRVTLIPCDQPTEDPYAEALRWLLSLPMTESEEEAA